ncbi:DUF2911 domain-containing protein [Porifericola rhodea]|uniref:DUF2911 domain-containing protein n=1 Tax=Porifericola rhodea TaxID=930972 RepID=UPI002665AB87|nr:DUF2911 domain-containing protein [Porifericola rhodea]WKN32368.1 DUF2911 domain-containing protein [Porifericola rhodea]
MSESLIAQQALEPKPSPMAVAKMKKDEAYIKVVYSRPHLRNRKMIGEQEPYGKVWRLGANEATEITLTEDVKLGGKDIEAGTYSMFAIPEKDKWTLILNSELGLWGAYEYDDSKDVARIEVPVKKNSEKYEPFTIQFNEMGTKMMIMWDNLLVEVPVEV